MVDTTDQTNMKIILSVVKVNMFFLCFVLVYTIVDLVDLT